MQIINIKHYNLAYINCTELISIIYKEISQLDISFKSVKEKDLKKLIFHYLITNLLKASNSRKIKNRPVYYFLKNDLLKFDDKNYIKCFLYVFKNLKNLLPVPLILLDSGNIFVENNGHLKGLNEKLSLQFIKNKTTSVKLRKYLEEEEFYELIRVLKDIKNIKSLST